MRMIIYSEMVLENGMYSLDKQLVLARDKNLSTCTCKKLQVPKFLNNSAISS